LLDADKIEEQETSEGFVNVSVAPNMLIGGFGGASCTYHGQ